MVDFRWESANYLWLLWLVPLLAIFSHLLRKTAWKRLENFAQEKSLRKIITGKEGAGGFFRKLFYYLALCCLIVSLARPQANPIDEEKSSTSLDIMIVLDVSRSMDAEDMYPSRLKKAKKSVNTLLDRLSGDRLGIVAFAGSAVLICPLTSDYDIVRTFLQSVDSNTIQNQGTNISHALDVSMRAFKRGSETALQNGSSSHLIILMSDGEDTVNEDALAAAKDAHKEGAILHAIAFGTEKGVPIPIRDDKGQLGGYKHDRAGNTVITKVDIKALKDIASAGGGNFYFSTLDEGEIIDILQKALNLQRADSKIIKTRVYQEYFMYPLLLGLIFILLSFLPSYRALLHKRASSVTNSFLLLLFLSMSLFGTLALAEEQSDTSVVDSLLWNKEKLYTSDAQKKFEQGKFSDATEKLKELQASNPSSGPVAYNLGTSFLKEKKYKEARTALEAAVQKNESALAAKFNLAGSYAEEKQNSEAKVAYASLINELHEKKNLSRSEQSILLKAKKNLEHLSDKEQGQQQKEQQKNAGDPSNDKKDQKQKDQPGAQQGKEGDQKKDEKNKDSESEKNPSKDDKKNSNENKKYDLGKKKNDFKERDDLSEQDAKRILENLNRQEGQLQKQFMKNKAKDEKDKNVEKDW